MHPRANEQSVGFHENKCCVLKQKVERKSDPVVCPHTVVAHAKVRFHGPEAVNSRSLRIPSIITLTPFFVTSVGFTCSLFEKRSFQIRT